MVYSATTAFTMFAGKVDPAVERIRFADVEGTVVAEVEVQVRGSLHWWVQQVDEDLTAIALDATGAELGRMDVHVEPSNPQVIEDDDDFDPCDGQDPTWCTAALPYFSFQELIEAAERGELPEPDPGN